LERDQPHMTTKRVGVMSILDRPFPGPSDLAVCNDLCDHLNECLSVADRECRPPTHNIFPAGRLSLPPAVHRRRQQASTGIAGRCDGNALKLGRSDKRSPAASSLSCNLPLPDSDKFFPTCDIRHRRRRPLASKAVRAVKPGILRLRYVSQRAHQSIGVSRPR
jgi:hypothetical protein